MKNSIGVYGLGVMGSNIAKNMLNKKGEGIAVYNYTSDLTEKFVQENPNLNVDAYDDLKKFISSLETPRKILLMVTAGPVVDSVIQSLIPLLSEGDIIMDGGNSNYRDSYRRYQELNKLGIRFLSVGVSGGEEGALHGPSLMVGGQKEAYDSVAPIFEAIAAKVDDQPCVTHIGPNSSGHFVKMVHNGIEYGDMQLIAEAYSMLKHVLNMDTDELHDVFSEWNKGELHSYLIEITADIFTKKDNITGKPLVDVILDRAGQKGTGKWTSKNALDLGVPLPIITESVFARFISNLKDERIKASKRLSGPNRPIYDGDRDELIETVRKALYMSKITSYAQGFAQMQMASREYGWELNYGDIAMIWRGGCIIQAQFLQKIKEAFDQDPNLANLMLDPYFKDIVEEYQTALREVVSIAVKHGIAVPAFSSAISYYDSYRSEELPANLIQAQRDYFGAHTYERKDREGIFHTEWLLI